MTALTVRQTQRLARKTELEGMGDSDDRADRLVRHDLASCSSDGVRCGIG
jgi:hypothetical protein